MVVSGLMRPLSLNEAMSSSDSPRIFSLFCDASIAVCDERMSFCAWISVASACARRRRRWKRSEEHTSELQSPCNLVCRLLLEKKKKHSLSNKYKNQL